MQLKARPRSLGAIAWPVAVWLVAASVFFRDFLLSGFDSIAGDWGDARFDIFVRENFYRFLQGKAEFTSPPMFYPIKDTLGYSDGYLLDAIVYVPLRMLGADPFLAFEILCITLSLVGFLSFNFLVTRYGGARQPFAATAAALFSFSSALFMKVGHPQMLEVNVTPIVAILMLQAVRHKGGRFGQIPAFFAGIVLALLFATGYYVAWFFTFIIALTLVGTAVVSKASERRRYIAEFRSRWRTGLTFLIGFTIGLIPFARMYAPILAEHAGRPFSEYLFYAPFPSDILNVGPGNMLWGRALDALNIFAKGHRGNGEVTLAVTPIVLVSYLVCVYAIWRGRLLADMEDRRLRAAVLGSFIALVLLWASIVKVGHFSLFWLEWHLIPGASAIRVGARAQIISNGFVAAVVGICLSRVVDDAATPRLTAVMWSLLLLCFVEQVNLGINHHLSRSPQMALLNSIARPPAECRSFFLAANPSKPQIEQHVDAILVAQRAGIPTLNGYSGWNPTGWPLFEINGPSYRVRAWDWAEDHDVTTGLCEYSIDRREWQLVDFNDLMWQPDAKIAGPAVTQATALDMRAGGNGIGYQAGNWSETPEAHGTWTDGARAGLSVLLSNWQGDMEIEVTARPFLVAQRHPNLAVDVLANGIPVAQWSYAVEQDDRPVTRTARVQAALLAKSDKLRIEFHIDRPASPSETGVSSDSRRLGLFVSKVSLKAPSANGATPCPDPSTCSPPAGTNQ